MNQENRENEKGTSPKRRGLKQWLIYAVICVVFEVILEVLIAHRIISIKPLIRVIVNCIFGSSTVISIFGLVFSMVTDEEKKKFWSSLHITPGETFWECFFSRSRRLFKRYVYRNWIIIFTLAASFFLCIPACAAQAGLSQKVASYLFNFEDAESTASTPPEPEPEPEPESEPEPEPEPEPKPEPSQPPNEHNEEDEEGSLAMRLVFTTQMPYTLSVDEEDIIYFLSGDYAITDWDDEEAVYVCVKGFVDSLRAQRLNPSFTEEDADPKAKNKLSYASGDEANMKVDSYPTSKILEDITDRRKEVYDIYPLYPLARLIRENFGMYGDAYKMQNKSKICAAIAYGKSIVYGFDTLRYDVSGKTLKANLDILVERYTKLGSVLAKETLQHKAALALADALQRLSDGI